MYGIRIQGSNSQSALFGSIIILILVGLLAVPAAAEEALPDTVRVNAVYNETTPDYDVLNFSKIQLAADAVAEEGMVTVAAGTYDGHLNLTRSVSLIADEGALIDGMGWGVGILIDADSVSIEGFTVTNTTTYGIAGNWFDGATIRDNIVTVVSGETTTEPPVGICLNGGTGHTVTGNTVTVESGFAQNAGIVAWEVTETLVSENHVSVNGVYVDDPPGSILAASSGASWGSNARKNINHALEDELVYMNTVGIVSSNSTIVIDGNAIEATSTCNGEDDALYYHTYAVGIQVDSAESIRLTNNAITVAANATSYAYADGIWAGGDQAVIEGNTINSTTIAEEAQPWGIEMWNAPKGMVLSNTILIAVTADFVYDTYGIYAGESEKAQVLDNTIVYNALIGSRGVSGADAGIEGIYILDCYQSQVSGNGVAVVLDVMATGSDIGFGSVESGISPTAAAVYNDLTGESVGAWAGVTGIDVDMSDEAWITENGIAVDALLASANVAGNVSAADGGVWATGLLIQDTGDAAASGNTIDVSFMTEPAAIGIGDNTSVAYVDLSSQVTGVMLYGTGETKISDNCITVESNQATVAIALSTGSENGGLVGLLDARIAENEMETNTFVASLDEEGMYTEATWDSLNATALARTRTTATAAGIYADTDGDTGIYDNTVDVRTASMVADIAMHNIISTDAMADAVGVAHGFGIIGPESDDAYICGNAVTVTSVGTIGTVSSEGEMSAESILSRSQFRIAAQGIVGLADENEISDNTVNAYAIAESRTTALGDLPGDESIALSSMATRVAGITIPEIGEYDDNEVSGNTVHVISSLAPTAVAEGTSGNVMSLMSGRAEGIGIHALSAWISDNRIDVLACVDNATAVAVEFSVLEVMSETVAIAEAQGIVTGHATIEDNVIFAKGNATGVVVAETDELLEDASASILIAGIGVAINDNGLSTMARNTAEGSGEAEGYGYAMGYRPEVFGDAFAEGIGIQTAGGTLMYNNIGGMLFGDYFWDEYDERIPTHAAYNWWGDASGPSGFGPGTGNPIYGVIYYSNPMTWEPWLTRPYETVPDNNKAYLGIELRPDDGLTPGWNTLSTPIALENNTWHAIHTIGEGLNYSAAYTWDATTQRWVQVMANTRISPLDAVYVLMNEDARLPIAISPDITGPPVKNLSAGWNLIGPAYAFDADYLEWDVMKVDKALVSVEKTPEGLTGYTIALSPSVNPEAWSYTVGANKAPTMEAGYGYWVYMENPDTLAGFSSTPLPLPDAGCLNAIQA